MILGVVEQFRLVSHYGDDGVLTGLVFPPSSSSKACGVTKVTASLGGVGGSMGVIVHEECIAVEEYMMVALQDLQLKFTNFEFDRPLSY